MLHNDAATFEQIILRVAEDTGIEPSIIEKDYYVTLFLQRIVERQPNIIFKGGTSLSKCYKLIKRFSEDIDLNIETENHPTQSERVSLKRNITAIVDELNLSLANPNDVFSRREYNRYVIDYPTLFSTNYIKENLVVETMVYIKAYPCKRMLASSLIYDYLKKNGYDALIEQYHLQPFEVRVQTAERTLIDKLFALGDYYLEDKIHEHSRHIYDIYKLVSVVSLDESLRRLANEVYEERKPVAMCRSAKDGIHMNVLLQEIIERTAYKQDYEDITRKILFEDVDYETAIAAVQKVIDNKIFQ